MSSSNPTIVFYDIASNQPLRTFAPNPWKTRFALNFKKLPYRTQWIDMPDITSLREGLGIPANRTHPDGTPFHTLPVIQDPTASKLLGDTFEIALYLDSAYPESPRLFRPQTTGLTAALNAHVDGLFTKFAVLCTRMPFDERCKPAVMAIFAKRAAALTVKPQYGPEHAEAMMVEFEAALGELAKAYRHTGGTTDYYWRAGGTEKMQSQRPPAGREEAGLFLDEDGPVYADFVVGAWLKMMEECMEPEHWKRLRTWQGGLWGNLVDALSKWAEIK